MCWFRRFQAMIDRRISSSKMSVSLQLPLYHRYLCICICICVCICVCIYVYIYIYVCVYVCMCVCVCSLQSQCLLTKSLSVRRDMDGVGQQERRCTTNIPLVGLIHLYFTVFLLGSIFTTSMWMSLW